MKIPWRREWLPTPVLSPGEFHGQRNLAGCYSQPMGLQRVGYNWATNAFTFHFIILWWLLTYINMKGCICGAQLKSETSPTSIRSTSHIQGLLWVWKVNHFSFNDQSQGQSYKESWVLKNWCFWIVVLETALWESLGLQDQPILKEIDPEYSLEGLTPRLKLQYFGHPIQRASSLEKTLILVKIEGRRRRGQQRTRWLDGIMAQWTWVWANSRRQWRTGKPGMLQFMGSQRVGNDVVTEQHSDNIQDKLSFTFSGIQ